MRLIIVNDNDGSSPLVSTPSKHVIVANNHVYEPVDSIVYMVGTYHAVVANNNFYKCGKDTIKFVERCQDVTCIGNVIEDAGVVNGGSTHGIQVTNMDGATVTGNTVTWRTQWGTEIMRPIGIYGATNVDCSNNTLSQCVH